MIRLASPTQISAAELQAWAYDNDPQLPENADRNCWSLMLEVWFADDRLYCELATDAACPKRSYLMAVVRHRLWRACQRTTWIGADTDILNGLPRAGVLAGLKGRGRKEKAKRITQHAESVADKAETTACEHARRLLQIAGRHQHPDLQELAARLHFKASGWSEAHAKAEKESRVYASENNYVAHPKQSGYEQDGEDLIDGYEIWSELFESRQTIEEFYAERYAKYEYHPE